MASETKSAGGWKPWASEVIRSMLPLLDVQELVGTNVTNAFDTTLVTGQNDYIEPEGIECCAPVGSPGTQRGA